VPLRDGDDRRPSVRERTARRAWRRRIAGRRAIDHPYRIAVGIVGVLIVAAGIVAIPLPGPGWLIVLAGLFVLATEFSWAERLLEFTRRQVMGWTDWVARQSLWLRVILALATAAFVCGVLVLTLHIAGVPSWAPGWLPLWR
jgi:uncharacterized protein (TIGR02611 family)